MVDLSGADEEALPGMEVIVMGLLFRIVGFQQTLSGQNVMKEKMIATRGTIGMAGFAFFPSEPIHAEIHKAVVRKNVKAHLAAGEGVDLPLCHAGCLLFCADHSIYHFAT